MIEIKYVVNGARFGHVYNEANRQNAIIRIRVLRDNGIDVTVSDKKGELS